MSTDPAPAGPPANDPSMDDILASIRRILDEESAKAAPDTPPGEGPEEPFEEAPLTTTPEPTHPAPAPAIPPVADLPEPEPEPERMPLPRPEPEPEPDEAPEVLELEASMMLPEPDERAAGPIPAPPPIRMEPLQDMSDIPIKSGPIPMPVPLAVPMPPPPLVAPEAAAAAATSVTALLRTLASERSTAITRGGPTIEDLVREEMRPLLKEWLDTHLPPLVERLVRAEIERVMNRTT